MMMMKMKGTINKKRVYLLSHGAAPEPRLTERIIKTFVLALCECSLPLSLITLSLEFRPDAIQTEPYATIIC